MSVEQAAAVLALVAAAGLALAVGPDDAAGRVGMWAAVLAGCVLAWLGAAVLVAAVL